ncbi:MAG: hypothetical protein PCFJNLEI_00551 [Verrucomicrobiae bacterium]|nr:hypothetical protein [Verrucomicrobiae bacterium]
MKVQHHPQLSRIAGAVIAFMVLYCGTRSTAWGQVAWTLTNTTDGTFYWTNSANWWSSAADGVYPGDDVEGVTTRDRVLLTNDLASATLILNSGLADSLDRLAINYLNSTTSTGLPATVIITNGASSSTIVTNSRLLMGNGARLQIDGGSVMTGVTSAVTMTGTNWSIALNGGSKLFAGLASGNNVTLGNNYSNLNATITSQDGGLWNMGGASGFFVGYNAATGNVLTVSGSVTLTNVGTSANMQVGGGGASWCSLILSNGAKLFGGDVYIAFTGSGRGGSNNTYRIGGLGAESTAANGIIYISQQGARDNSIILTNARWTTSGAVNIGYAGTNNSIQVYSNAVWNPLNQTITIGNGAGYSNNLIVAGGTVTNAGAVLIGTSGAGSSVLTIQDGGKFFSGAAGNVTVGNTSSGTNTYNVGGFGLSSTVSNGTITVGASTSRGFNVLNITNALLRSGASTIGNGSSNNSAVVSSGGLWNLQGTALNIGNANATNNSLTVNIGGVVSNANITVGVTGAGGAAATANNRLTLNGGTVWANALRITNAVNTVAYNSGTLNSSSTFITNGQAFVVGNGTQSANFNILGGTHAFQDGLVVSSNARLTGDGLIVGNLTNDGVLSPGFSVGSLSITGNVALRANSLVLLELAGPGSNDLIVVSGSLAFGGTLAVTNSTGFTLADGQTYQLFQFGSHVADTDFAFMDLPDVTALSLQWDTSALATTGNITLVLIPEPGSLVLVGVGLGLLLVCKRRPRRHLKA